MKKGIHPEYKKARITCGCGNVIETQNTAGDLTVEICSACHPFFTGKQKLVDTAGRVDKFKERQEKAEKLKDSKRPMKTKKKEDARNLNEKTHLRKNTTDEQIPEIKKELKKEAAAVKLGGKKEENKDNKPDSAETTTDK